MAEYYMAMLQLIINCKYHTLENLKTHLFFCLAYRYKIKIKKIFKTIFNIYFLVLNF